MAILIDLGDKLSLGLDFGIHKLKAFFEGTYYQNFLIKYSLNSKSGTNNKQQH